MIVVEKDRKQTHVLARRFRLFVVVGPDFLGRLLDRRRRAAVELYELERFDLLRLAVLGDVEIRRLQIGNLIAVTVGDDDVDAHEIDAGTKHRLLRIACSWLLPW